MAEVRSLDEALKILTDILEPDEPITSETRLNDTDVDSLDILEWMYELGIESEEVLDDDEVLDSFSSLTVGGLYRLLVADTPSA